MSQDAFTDLQEAVATYLGAHPFFAGQAGQKRIEILTEKIGDIAAAVTQRVAKIGLCGTVLTPIGSVEIEDAAPPTSAPPVVITFVENVTINRAASGTQQPASKCAQGCAAILHQNADLGAQGMWLRFKEIQLNQNLRPALAYDVIFAGPIVTFDEPTR